MILKVILEYSRELKEAMQENIQAYGYLDADTKRTTTEYMVIEELLNRLELNATE